MDLCGQDQLLFCTFPPPSVSYCGLVWVGSTAVAFGARQELSICHKRTRVAGDLSVTSAGRGENSSDRDVSLLVISMLHNDSDLWQPLFSGGRGIHSAEVVWTEQTTVALGQVRQFAAK